MTSKVDSIVIMIAIVQEGKRELANARAALGEEDGEMALVSSQLVFLYERQRRLLLHKSQLGTRNKRGLGCSLSKISFYGHNAGTHGWHLRVL